MAGAFRISGCAFAALVSTSLVACGEPGPQARAAEELGVVEASELYEGRDGGLSAIAFGRSVWVYGDTVLTVEDEWGHNWHHNSFSVTQDVDARDGVGGFTETLDPAGAPRHLIPPSPDELSFNLAHWGEDCEQEPCGARWAVWPGDPVWDAEAGRALIFYGLIYAEPGEFNFTSVGQSVAVWDVYEEPPRRPVIHPEAEHPDLLFLEGEPGWGVGSNIEDGFLYTFSCDEDGLGHPCRLARVAAAEVLERDAWRYWDGASWSTEMDEADKLFEGAPIMEVSRSEHHGGWLAIYSSPFSRDVVARTAPALTGPWTRESVIYTAPGDDAPYDVVHHPEYAEEAGRVQYLTYSRPTTGWFGTEFPLVRVEFE
ncbi:MAG: DUF4185 domain-containing protein [Myxococcales bacterium]|nr:DUF4185 domain-containing protein [Myxococcales bacterium]MCB9750900.1 DUF4185 domain-containing protein [Myxococcales bacterium]